MANKESKTSINSPPAGTGNVPGLGEAFNINLSTGQGVYSYKIVLPGGVAGHGPSLTLEYAHGTGHGVFGLGWKLPLRSIRRRLDFGVPAEEMTEYYMDAGSDLLQLSDGTYAAKVETVFNRYSRNGEGWHIEERNGMVHDLGLKPAARLSEPSHPERIIEWLLERSLDSSGNAIEYSYHIDEAMVYPAEIRYAVYAIRFNYEDRPDKRLSGRTGYIRRCAKRCNKIELFLDPGLNERRIRSWSFIYKQAAGSEVSLLSSIQMISYGAAIDSSQDVVRAPVMFQYSTFELEKSRPILMESSNGSLPPSLTDKNVALVTLDNAPLPGVLQIINGRQYYWRNLGDGTWATPHPVTRVPAVSSFDRSGLAFIDMDASGTADLLAAGGESLPGYYENGGTQGWNRFVAYPRGKRSAPYWKSEQLRLSDLNGDGKIDAMMTTRHSFAIWLNEGVDGWSDPLLTPKEGNHDMPNFSDPFVFLADMTGDGLDDLVRIRSGLVEYWPGLGYGHFGEKQIMLNSPRLKNGTSSHDGISTSLLLIDVDGDGCADLVRVTPDGVEVCQNKNGISFSEPVIITDIPVPIPGTLRAANMQGRSGTGLIWNTPRGQKTAYVSLKFGTDTPAYLLNRIENGAGLVSEIFYHSAVEEYIRDYKAGEQWDTNFPFPYLIVIGTREYDQVSGRTCDVSYRYHAAHYETASRQFQGFRRTERLEKGDESRADTLTVFHFLMGQERIQGNGSEYSALNGMLRRTELYSIDGTPQQTLAYRIEESDYDLSILNNAADGRMQTFVSVKQHRIEDHERTDDLRGEEKTYSYDAFGNVIKEIQRGYGIHNGKVQPERICVTEISYAKSSTAYIVDKPSRILIRDAEGELLTEENRYYDGVDFQGLPYGDANRGLLSRKEQLVLNSTEFDQHYAGMNATDLGYFLRTNADGVAAYFVNAESFAYDTHGNRISQKDALGNQTSYSYDADNLFRINLTTSLGVTCFDYDRAIGEPIHITYPDTSEALFAYDAQGRILASVLPGESLEQPPAAYTFNDSIIPNSRTGHFSPTDDPADDAVAVTYFDGYGKEFQQRAQTKPGKFVVSGLRLLNSRGDLKKEYEPTFDNTSVFSLPSTNDRPCREFQYDALGRVIKIINFNGGISTAEYHSFEIITNDANDTDNSPDNITSGQLNTPHSEEFDVFRYRTRTTEMLGGGQTLSYSFVSDSRGQLLQTADDIGVTATYTYDHLGQRILIRHREAGERRLWYDARGVIVRTIDSNGNVFQAEIDERRRLSRLKLNGAPLEEYTYDDLNRNALGRLSRVTYSGGYQAFGYDAQGRLAVREYHFENLVNNQSLVYSYDRLGRETSVTHMDGDQNGLTINYKLTDNGWIRAIPGYITEVEYDPRGLSNKIIYNNGVITQMTYTSGPGRVASQTTTSPSAQVMEQVKFNYDKMELLLSSNDSAAGGRGLQTYKYDALYQLTSAGAGGANPSSQYSYTNKLNLSRFDEMGSKMHYDDMLHPNRLAGLELQNLPRFDVPYDNNGNLLRLPEKTFSYNAKNELLRFEAADGLRAEYTYDHKGQRVSKKVTDKQGTVTNTFFVGDLVEIRNSKPAYFIRLGALRAAIVAYGEKRYVHGDYLGSSAFFTDDVGTKIAAIAYKPFGNTASSQGMIDFRTFGVHPFDAESGLFYMKRRYYAPEIGRFITPDPIAIYQPTLNLHNPKALHPFNFVANDPLNKTDLTGLSFWSVFGAIVGVIAAIAVAALVVLTGGLLGVLIGAALAIGLVVVSYVVASETAGTPFGEFMRGFMIGLNSGLNAIIAGVIFGPAIGVALGVINFLAAFDTIANSSVYQGILGWSSWLMPMSWLATGIGLVFFLLNVIPMIFTGNQVEAVKIHSLSIDWGTGTIVMEGGWTYLSGFRGGYNLGNFAYITPGSTVTDHETGHTLNVAAFGSIFHFIGAIDENAIQSTPADAYAERLADSHDPNGPTDRAASGEDPVIPAWV